MLEKYEEIIKFLRGKKSCYCYGAGEYGQRFVRYCKKRQIKIHGFIVSDDQIYNTQDLILGLPVYKVSSILEQKENFGVIIAIDAKYHDIILQNLHKLNPRNIEIIPQVPFFLEEDYKNEVEKRAKLSIFDYQELAVDMDLVTREKCGFNAFYGHDRIIKKLLHKDEYDILDASIEHAPAPKGNILLKDEVVFGKTHYTTNRNRTNLFQKYLPDKNVESIGLYMQYTDSLLSDQEQKKMKEELGKTLLVFPYHSTHLVETNFNENAFIDQIEKLKSKFETVLICMYWKDILLKREQPYLEKKYKIVTAGHIYDYHFLARLKSIIQLSDITMSNEVGSHLGYCVYLGKPHYLYLQDVEFVQNGKKIEDVDKFGTVDADLCIIKFDAHYQKNVKSQAVAHFGKYKEFLTVEDLSFVKKYWGEWQ